MPAVVVVKLVQYKINDVNSPALSQTLLLSSLMPAQRRTSRAPKEGRNELTVAWIDQYIARVFTTQQVYMLYFTYFYIYCCQAEYAFIVWIPPNFQPTCTDILAYMSCFLRTNSLLFRVYCNVTKEYMGIIVNTIIVNFQLIINSIMILVNICIKFLSRKVKLFEIADLA